MFFATVANADVVKLNSTNAVTLNDYVTNDSVQRVVNHAKQLDQNFPDAGPIYLVLHSGGGSVDAGIEMINNLKSLKRPVHTITILAASMAFHTVQALGTRYIIPMGTLMQHKAKGGLYGEFPDGNLDSQFKYWSERIRALELVTATRAHYPAKALTAKFDNEYWCNAKDCIKERFADKYATAECDASLAGTTEVQNKKYVELQGGAVGKLVVTMTYAACPLQTSPLDVDVKVYGMDGTVLTGGFNPDMKKRINDVIEGIINPSPVMWFKNKEELAF
jgi:ATP-dependent protease ClpP protease subunit